MHQENVPVPEKGSPCKHCLSDTVILNVRELGQVILTSILLLLTDPETFAQHGTRCNNYGQA